MELVNKKYTVTAQVLTPLSIGQGSEKDWVYAVKYRGNSLEIGAKVPMGAILTLVIGNGEEAPADSLQVDSLDVPQVQGEVLEEEDWF